MNFKNILAFAVLLTGISGTSSIALATTLNDQFTVGCAIQLIGLTEVAVNDSKASAPAEAAAGPFVSFDLGDYVLAANAIYAITDPNASDDGEAKMRVSLFKKTQGPIVGQVNEAGVSGIKDIQVGQSRTIDSTSFLNLTYNGKAFTRIDYSCTITRVQ